VKGKLHIWLPGLFLLVFVVTRWPKLMPLNFSAAYALAFCAGAFFPGRIAWWLPLATLFGSELFLNAHYGFPLVNGYTLVNALAYAVLIGFGRLAGARASLLVLLGGSLLGAIIFYLITNSFSWLQNPAYTKSLAGWLKALSLGTDGWPETWKFFRNTLTSTALFTALFGAAWKLTAGESPAEKGEEAQPEEAPEPEEAKA